MEKPIVIFDLDGTLININSIAELIGDWDEFHAASLKCPANEPILEFAKRCQIFSHLIVVTGKPESFRRGVEGWLSFRGLLPEAVLMRPTMSSDSDAQLKPMLMEKEFGPDWKSRVMFAVEDRDKMTNAWRAEGITCLQCAESLY